MALTYYGTDPWENVDKNQRQWYDPLLQQIFRRQTVYTGLVPYATQPMLDARTTRMTITMTLDFHPDFSEIGLRQLDGSPMGLDSKSVDIVFTRYGGVTQYHKYDPMISYWQQNGQTGLVPIIQDKLGRNIVEVHDLLIRNAFLSSPYVTLAGTSYTGCDQLTDNDKFDLDMVTDSILRAQTQNVLTSPNPAMASGSLLFIDTPGQINTIQKDTDWVTWQQYGNAVRAFNSYEVGSYKSSRHLMTGANVLWNCGAKTAQTTLAASRTYQDGSPDPDTTRVDEVYATGQSGATHDVEVADSSGFSVGDMVTFHKKFATAAQVAAKPKLRALGSPLYDDGLSVTRRVVAVPDGTHVQIDQPLGVDFTTEVNTNGSGAASPSSGVYGWMTKGRSLHVSIAIAGPNGVVAGVAQPPQLYAPPAVDDWVSVHRFSWDAYEKFQLFRPEVFEVFVTSGVARVATYKYN